MKFFLTIIIIFFCRGFAIQTSYAQELNCRVTLNSNLIQSSDRAVFTELQNTITEFMNSRRWTGDVYTNQERISCNLVITITDKPSINQFKASVQVQSDRVIYGTAYNSVLFNFVDNDWAFEYNEYQSIEFADNTVSEALPSFLAFYAYVIIGLDYDSFSKFGGTPFFQKAQTIVNLKQNANSKGWKSFENTKNRYWLIENLMNKQFQPVRESFYLFHRKALDEFIGNEESGRATIITCLKKVQRVHYDKPGSILLRMFFDAKSDELVNIFGKANPQDKQLVLNLLNELDPTNNEKYQKINKN